MKNQQQNNDDLLWQTAKRRADFKASLLVYALVNFFLIGVWYFTSGSRSYFWPVWPLLGWGIGIVTQYMGAYHSTTIFSAEKEYKKLTENHFKL